jgi:NADH-quinone oxidoreductase subunit D
MTLQRPSGREPQASGGVIVDPALASPLADSRMNVELDNGDMILNIGPQHPATHGTLRLVVRLDGERVITADPVIGYMHRGYEKLTEFRTYPQITTLINRIDWLSSFANEVPFIAAAERLMGIEAAPRALYIRAILTELARISTFLLFLGEMGLQVGAITPAFFGFRDREYTLNLIEGATGGRFHPNYNRIGGIKEDLPWGWTAECRSTMRKMLDSCDDFEDLVLGNPIFQQRTRGVGIIPPELGTSYGVSGSNLRASGVDWDLRRDGDTYLPYDAIDWKVYTHPDGDSFARYWVRLQETRESARMVLQFLDAMPDGPIMAKVPRIIKVPEGEMWVNTENPLGEMGYYVISKGATGPFRVKIRSASFSNVSILPWLLRGIFVPDVITVLASLYFILGDIDR